MVGSVTLTLAAGLGMVLGWALDGGVRGWTQIGFRLGRSAGSETVVQRSFDDGFGEGVQTGKLIGEVYGALVTARKCGLESEALREALRSFVRIAKAIKGKHEEDGDAVADLTELAEAVKAAIAASAVPALASADDATPDDEAPAPDPLVE